MEKERINQAEAYNSLTRDGDVILESLEIEVRDHPLVVAFHPLPNTKSKNRACDFDLNVEYRPSDEDYLDNNKHDLYVVSVTSPIVDTGQSNTNYFLYTINDLPKVWDLSNGAKLYTFKGNNAPVCSVCSHSKNNTYYAFSISNDRQMEAWLYENNGLSSESCTHNALVYNADGFMKIEENRFSMKLFFEIHKQKYLEALDKGKNAKALDVLKKQLKPLALYMDSAMLLSLDNFRENEHLSAYSDAAQSARTVLLTELKRLIEANPLIRNKVQFPNLKTSRLRSLINQSLNWQHQLCRTPNPNNPRSQPPPFHSGVGGNKCW